MSIPNSRELFKDYILRKIGAPVIEINPAYEAMRKLNYLGFEHIGFPYYGWLIAIHTAVLRIADNFGINLIFYGEY